MAEKGYTDLLKLLVQQYKVDVNAKDSNGVYELSILTCSIRC